jgi:hypothetical protein
MNCWDCEALLDFKKAPMVVCKCGALNMRRAHKYMVDFTLVKHGQFLVYANNEKDAVEKFRNIVKAHKEDTQKFIEHFVFDFDIKPNYAYHDSAPKV